MTITVRDHIPLEQGLRLDEFKKRLHLRNVRDHIPLEQGLRLLLLDLLGVKGEVRDHIPLEQGLRRRVQAPGSWQGGRQRPYSIRTRIKTQDDRCRYAGQLVRDHIPLEQGLRR